MKENATAQASAYSDMGNQTEEEQPYLSKAELDLFLIINHVVLSGVFCLIGIVANIINMIIFVMQGLNSPMNITFFAIAVSDLCSLITLEWLNINLNPFMENADLPYEPSEIQYLTGGWPHICFSRVTCWLTIYVTAERCLCIALPLKVKQIITPRVTIITVCAIYFFMLLTLIPEYATLYFGDKYNPKKNKTLIALVSTQYRPKLEGLIYIVYAVINIVSFFIITLLTCILVIKLRRRTEWRTKSTSDRSQSETLTLRDKKTMNLVLLISLVLIVTYTPGTAFHISMFIQPEFGLNGKYSNVFNAAWSFGFLCESINCTVNIILYYKMSSKFRQTFRKLFSRCLKADVPNSWKGRRSSGISSVIASSVPLEVNGNVIDLDGKVSFALPD